MKTTFLIFVFCLSANTFAQQLNEKTERLPLLIKLKYQNIENKYSNTIDLKPNLYNQIISIGVKAFPKNNFNTKNINFAFSETLQLNLSKELRNIMHKYPGDGNYFIDARGLKH